ncbi:telomerase Cajal body protein 1 isoform X4 [Abrus precatorius]|uniref:Telomerase Cajal body protein 1 isoform X4 n=1 Tax=Abrus precatorius TaxID=3816 RepID=A0A8B8KSU5_ABRPR|nr:telomerase Cajal body protein 1 isoform X4 [Abrus precatorius]
MGEEEAVESESNVANAKEDYSSPVLRFNVPPHRTYHFHNQFITPSNPNNFLKAVKWSPDGSSFLTSSDDNTLRLFTPPASECDIPVAASNDESDSFAANVVMSEGESIHDFCWYPYMSSSDLVTNVFATTTRDHPIHLWDATSGQLRCTYRAYDAMDEITAAFSIAFNPAGTKIFAGYNKCIRMFDLHRPGRDFELYSTVKDKKEGQTGIISAMAFSPFHSGMLALGSYNQTTAIYREDNMELLYVLHGQEGGITHVQFSRDGNYLYTGGRKDPYILCWDVRKAVDCVYKLYRSSENTNQRILFDVDPSGQHLGTGGQDGLVHIYNLQTGQWVSSFEAALGHRRFVIPDDGKEDLCLSGRENCVSVWTFCSDSMMEIDLNNDGSFNNRSESGVFFVPRTILF